ncbi:MAG: DNA polymerase I [Nitrosomonadales bacterium]|nr:DNA polymerase I [Nitrosomonadales bacterium]|tara:strand:- start:2646 stop:5363 length:2718 start_codon:yes stop_codon:yes gene_type:complete
MKTLLLVDGSSYLYRAFHALPDLKNKDNHPTGVIYGVLNMLRLTHSQYPSDYSVCIFDAKGKTFRNDIYKDYKANRPKMPEDLAIQIEPLKKAISAMGWPIMIKDAVEADDVIGTLSKQANAKNIKVIISTGDKDLAQLVNKDTSLINTMTNEKLDIAGVKNKFGIPPSLIIDYLTIIGDKADNIPGVEKVGPKTALKWLDEYKTLEKIVKNSNLLSGVVGENLRKATDWLPIAKDLITIRCNLDMKVDWQQFIKKDANQKVLKEIYEEFNFTRWLQDLEKNENKKNKIHNIESNTKTNIFINKKSYITIKDEKILDQWIDEIKSKKIFAIDTETDSLNVMLANLVGISISLKAGYAAYIPLKHQTSENFKQLDINLVIQKIKPILEDHNIIKIGQNIKFDAHIFQNYGINLKGIEEDTMLMSYILESHQSHGMDKLSKRHLGHDCISYESLVGKGVKQITFDQVYIEEAAPYAAEDADVTFQLFQYLNKLLKENNKLLKVYKEIEISSMKALIKVERNGVLIDPKILQKQSHEIGEKLINIEKEAFILADQPFNLSSPKQLQEILFDKLEIKPIKKTPTGKPSTSEEVLQILAQDYPLPKLILEHRSLSKLKTTYTDKLPKMINKNTGRVHTSYNQAVAITGRLASSDPNLQNIPIRTLDGRKVREAFIAPKGSKILSADYSQIELRIMAHLSKDKRLIQAFKNNEDIHRITAAEIFNTSIDNITNEQRRYAKVINFGLIYGMGPFSLAKNLNIERSAAQNYIERYFTQYPSVKKYMEDAKQVAREKGFVETHFGRRLWLPEINGANGISKAAAERAAINGPMQGTAADLIKLAMIDVQTWIDKESNIKGKMIMQVHDELVFEVPDNEVEIFKKIIPNLMEKVASLSVPLIVDVGQGHNWEQAH